MALSNVFSDKNERKAKDDLVGGYNSGLNKLEGSYGRAQDRYWNYEKEARPAAGAYSDALGLNGADGNARAVNQFQAGPGYQFQLQQGQQAINRTAASRGMLASGNTSLDLLRYSQGLADQEYDDYLNRLDGQQRFGLGVADRAGAIDTGLGDVRYATSLGKAGARANFQAGKDVSGLNTIGTISGGVSTGARLLGGGVGGPQPINRV